MPSDPLILQIKGVERGILFCQNLTNSLCTYKLQYIYGIYCVILFNLKKSMKLMARVPIPVLLAIIVTLYFSHYIINTTTILQSIHSK